MIPIKRETLLQAELCTKWISELSLGSELLFLGLSMWVTMVLPLSRFHIFNTQKSSRHYLDSVWREPPTTSAHASHTVSLLVKLTSSKLVYSLFYEITQSLSLQPSIWGSWSRVKCLRSPPSYSERRKNEALVEGETVVALSQAHLPWGWRQGLGGRKPLSPYTSPTFCPRCHHVKY